MEGKPKGTLILIGGHEDKKDDQVILKRVAEKAIEGRPIVLITAASREHRELVRDYRSAFEGVGVRHLEALEIHSREDAYSDENVKKVEAGEVYFFTGGDQLKLTSQLGETPVFKCIKELFWKGAVVAGTSAGAAAMPQTMITSGPDADSHELSDISMAPGLGFIDDVVVDTHFSQRGRMGRLLSMIASNPRVLGLGIDEDTAVVVQDDTFFVLGNGAVYVVDGDGITFTSLSERRRGIVTVCDVKLHLLAQDSVFNLETRKPEIAR